TLTLQDLQYQASNCYTPPSSPPSTPGYVAPPLTGLVNSQGMPILSPSACGSTQTYVLPGGSMGPQFNNQITPTGACIDSTTVPIPQDSSSGSCPFWTTRSDCTYLVQGIPDAAFILGGAALLLMVVMK